MAESTSQGSITMAKRLWAECRGEWFSARHTPFVIALASGNLELDTFRNFVSQQFHLFDCYAQALDKAEECADDETKMSIRLLIEDNKNHSSAFKKRGFDMIEDYPAHPATDKYRGDLLKTASGKVDGVKLATPIEKSRVSVYTLGAILPHIQLYNFIGQELQSLPGASVNSHPYKNWIEYHSSKYFQVSVLLAESVLNISSVSLPGEEIENLQKVYHHAIKLELDFFSAQKSVIPLLKEYNPADHHLMIFSNFDQTFTVENSATTLGKLRTETGKKYSRLQSQNQIDWNTQKAELYNRWKLILKDYKEDCTEWLKKTAKAAYNKKVTITDQSTIDETKEHEGEKFNKTLLKNALEELSKIVKRFNARIIESRLLKGFNLEDIKRAGESLRLQDGCMSLFKSITKSESISASIHVLSPCRCNDLIKTAFSSGDLSSLEIHANEFVYEESITPTGEIMTISTGKIIRKVESPIDKLELFRDIIKKNDNGRNKFMLFGNVIDLKKNKLIVYIGRSVKDLLCLVEADIGIVIGSDELLEEVGKLSGVNFVPLFQRSVQKHTQKETVKEKTYVTLYTVSSWAEIHAFIFGS